MQQSALQPQKRLFTRREGCFIHNKIKVGVNSFLFLPQPKTENMRQLVCFGHWLPSATSCGWILSSRCITSTWSARCMGLESQGNGRRGQTLYRMINDCLIHKMVLFHRFILAALTEGSRYQQVEEQDTLVGEFDPWNLIYQKIVDWLDLLVDSIALEASNASTLYHHAPNKRGLWLHGPWTLLVLAGTSDAFLTCWYGSKVPKAYVFPISFWKKVCF